MKNVLKSLINLSISIALIVCAGTFLLVVTALPKKWVSEWAKNW